MFAQCSCFISGSASFRLLGSVINEPLVFRVRLLLPMIVLAVLVVVLGLVVPQRRLLLLLQLLRPCGARCHRRLRSCASLAAHEPYLSSLPARESAPPAPAPASSASTRCPRCFLPVRVPYRAATPTPKRKRPDARTGAQKHLNRLFYPRPPLPHRLPRCAP